MSFEGEVHESKFGRQILVYRLRKNPSLCFKYSLKRKHLDGAAYICEGCNKAKKKLRANFQQKSIHVNGNIFAEDPEQVDHLCMRSRPEYLFPYEKLAVDRIARLVFKRR